MEQERKNIYAFLLWEKCKVKFEDFATKNIGNIELPLEKFDINITGPLYRYFYTVVTGKDQEPLDSGNEIMRKNTFDRQLQKEFSGTMNTQTLNMYAVFVGYKSFEDFVLLNPITDIEEKSKSRKRYLYLGLLVLVVSCLILFIYKLNNEKRLLNYNEEEKVFLFIKAALEAELNTYQNSPRIDTTQISKFYTKDVDDFWATMFRVLTMHHEKNLSITNENNPSGYLLVDKRIDAITDSTITVKTIEKWDLIWYDNNVLAYDSVQIRKNTFYNTYVLKKIGTNFQIIAYKTDDFKRRYDWKKHLK